MKHGVILKIKCISFGLEPQLVSAIPHLFIPCLVCVLVCTLHLPGSNPAAKDSHEQETEILALWGLCSCSFKGTQKISNAKEKHTAL